MKWYMALEEKEHLEKEIFDMIKWRSITNTMKEMGFYQELCSIIYNCISSASFSACLPW